MNDTAELAKALVKATLEFDQVLADKKISYNQTRFNYANLDSIIQATRKALANNGLVLTTSVSVEANKVSLKPRLIHASGEWLEYDAFTLKAKSESDKDIGAAITYARRYTQLSILNVYGEEPDIEEIEAGRPADRIQPQRVEKKHPTTALEVKDQIIADLREQVGKLSAEDRDKIAKDLKISWSEVKSYEVDCLFAIKAYLKDHAKVV